MSGSDIGSNIRKKTESTSSDADNSENTCVVCFKNVDIYSIGECDHPVCFECSTRMRVLCEKLECPICRQGLGKVIFTSEKLLYRQLETKNRSEYYSVKYKICFWTKAIQQAFYNLLDHPCPKCDHPVFRKFTALRDHVRREHDLYYCDLCTDNLNIFSFERRCYTKAELGLHRRKGDPDNKSHRGHPLCELCDKRYLNVDELYLHSRRDHYFCHFCDADGFNVFYKDYDTLKEHFRKDHFLCEEGRCATEEFTGAFRTEIDYKAHIANVHGKSLNKQQAKQARTLQLEITLGPRGRSGQTEPHIASLRSRGADHNEEEQAESFQAQQPQRAPQIDARNEQDFPSLGGSAPSTLTLLPPPMGMRTKLGSAGLARTKENFPALGGNDSGGGGIGASNSRTKQTSVSSVVKKNPSMAPTGMVIHVSNRPSSSASVTSKKPNPSNKSDFPALPGTSKAAASAAMREDLIPSNSNINMNNVSAKHRSLMDDYVSVANPSNFHKIQMVQKEAEEARVKKAAFEASAPKLNSFDFPALALGSKPSAPAIQNWTKPQKQREVVESRRSKVAPAPLLNINSKQKNKYGQNGNGSNNNNTTTENSNKKDKKNKNAAGEGKKNPELTGKQKKENNNENKPANANLKKEVLANGNDRNLSESFSSEFLPRSLGPPPGFSAPLKPPPGFQNVTLNSVAKSPNNLTFTSSLGESYNIVPSHNYIQPPESVTRNQKLVGLFKDALRTPEALDEFRQISQKFREGIYKAQPYYEHCQAALKDKFDNIFPELLSLLPDIPLQQALYLVHSQHLKALSNDQKVLLPKLEVCSTCKQVLLSPDADSHYKLHAMRSSFPTLGKSDNKGNSITACRK